MHVADQSVIPGLLVQRHLSLLGGVLLIQHAHPRSRNCDSVEESGLHTQQSRASGSLKTLGNFLVTITFAIVISVGSKYQGRLSLVPFNLSLLAEEKYMSCFVVRVIVLRYS